MSENKALEALKLFEEYERTPTDRGGKDGPKGRAWTRFVEAKNEALKASRLGPVTEADVRRMISGVISGQAEEDDLIFFFERLLKQNVVKVVE